jgi:hypothetical protein
MRSWRRRHTRSDDRPAAQLPRPGESPVVEDHRYLCDKTEHLYF